MDDVENEHITQASLLLLKAANLMDTAVKEADCDDSAETIEFLKRRTTEVRDLANFLAPPKPCWPFQDGSNVIPLIPLRTRA